MINKQTDDPKKRIQEYLKKAKKKKPPVMPKEPTGKINKTDRGFKDDG